jgi:hypothetical protein
VAPTYQGPPGYWQQPPPRKSRTGLVAAVIVASVAVLVLAVVIVGASAHWISFGSSSSDTSAGNSTDNGSGTNNGAGGSNNAAGANAGGNSGANTGGGAQPAQNPIITGAWSGTLGQVTVLVNKVEVRQGYVGLYVKVTNNGNSETDLPLFGYFNATDNLENTYNFDINNSTRVFMVGGGSFVTGLIVLTPQAPAGATTLKITFTTIFGLDAPRGSLSVSNIPIPH